MCFQFLQTIVLWVTLLAVWLHLIGFGLLYLHTCLYDIFVAIPVTFRRYDELKPLGDPGMAGEGELSGQQVMSLLRRQVRGEYGGPVARSANQQPQHD